LDSVLKHFIFFLIFFLEFMGYFIGLLLFFNSISFCLFFFIFDLLFSSFNLFLKSQLFEFSSYFLSAVMELRNSLGPVLERFSGVSTKGK